MSNIELYGVNIPPMSDADIKEAIRIAQQYEEELRLKPGISTKESNGIVTWDIIEYSVTQPYPSYQKTSKDDNK